MRVRTGLVGAALAVLLAATTGACGRASAPADDGPTPLSSASAFAQNVAACQAVTKATATYRPQVSFDTRRASADARVFRSWAAVVSTVAASVDAPVLKAQLLNLADTLRGWSSRQPSESMLVGYVDDVGRACDKFLNPPAPTATP
jgi:hypothetical protein